jgi:predicted amidohydrolase YtcJ
MGHRWDETSFAEKRYPNLRDLDDVSPDNPVVLYRQYGRVCVVNSKALELAGVTEGTNSLLGGAIDKEAETGDLTGVLRENATDLVEDNSEPDERHYGGWLGM